MISLLKTFGKGFLYVLGLPFFLVALALFGAIGLLAFVFQILKSIVFFFTGHKFFPELKEDRELRQLKEKMNQSNETSEPVNQAVDNSPSIITPIAEEELVKEKAPIKEEAIPTRQETNAPKESTIEEACFENKEDLFNNLLKEEDKSVELEKPVFEQPVVEETIIETNKEKTPIDTPIEKEDDTLSTLLETKESENESEEDLVEQLETYVPKSSNYQATEDDEDDDTDSGVSIKYDL